MAKNTTAYDRAFAQYCADMDAWWIDRQRLVTEYMRATARLFRLRD